MADSTRPQAVVFDLDGLMINTEELYDDVGDQVLRRRGKRFMPDLKDQMMGRTGVEAVQIMIDWHRLSDSVETLQAEAEEIFSKMLPKRLAPMPGLLKLLDAIQAAGIAKAIATSSRRRFAQQALSLLKINSTFQFILTAEDVRHGKPHPEIYRTAAKLFQLPPGQMLVLEDSENGCSAAVAAGALTIAVPGSHSRHHSFQHVELIADSLADRRIYQLLAL